LTWYAVHTIVSIRPDKPSQDEILIYENVILIEATDGKEAANRARLHAEAAISADDSLTINDEPATERYVGIRKIIAVSNPWPMSQNGERPVDGTEITYSKFRVKDEDALAKLEKGEKVAVGYLE
jgi:hypothetical protein